MFLCSDLLVSKCASWRRVFRSLDGIYRERRSGSLFVVRILISTLTVTVTVTETEGVCNTIIDRNVMRGILTEPTTRWRVGTQLAVERTFLAFFYSSLSAQRGGLMI